MRKKAISLWRLFVVFVGIALLAVAALWFMGRAPANFVPGTVVTIPAHSSTREAGELLESAHVVRSGSIFQFVIKTLLASRPVIAGDFQFDKPYGVLHVARLVTGGGFGATQVRITIPEGSSVVEIARIVSKAIPSWNADEFVAKAKPFEGTLFPETYIVFKTITVDELITKLKREYDVKVSPIRAEIQQSGKTESQIIIMASILEKEARNADEAKTVSGILWKRISIGTPLQVDAPFLYTLGKTSKDLKAADLRKDGPYNTYTRKGLPVGPIGNPGMAMIMAALYPSATPYLYYLHDSHGTIHYAKTYPEHVQNMKRYLGK